MDVFMTWRAVVAGDNDLARNHLVADMSKLADAKAVHAKMLSQHDEAAERIALIASTEILSPMLSHHFESLKRRLATSAAQIVMISKHVEISRRRLAALAEAVAQIDGSADQSKIVLITKNSLARLSEHSLAEVPAAGGLHAKPPGRSGVRVST